MTFSEWPNTLPKWRDRCFKPEGSWPYDLWKPESLQNFFREHGYHLWVTMHECGLGDEDHHHLSLIPPNDEPRRPDGYTFVTRYQCEPGIVIHRANFHQLVRSKFQYFQFSLLIAGVFRGTSTARRAPSTIKMFLSV